MSNISLSHKCFLNRLRWKIYAFNFFVICITFTFLIACFLAVSPIAIDDCSARCATIQRAKPVDSHYFEIKSSAHKLAILVPFRDRFEELLIFAPHLHEFLYRQDVNHHIYVLNQVDGFRFNRASLINVGFQVARDKCDYIAMHDVDLIPLNPQLHYSYPENEPLHIASPDLHPRYHYRTFVGGILLVKREHFERVNGMSNKYWGWGLEDDEFYVRLKEAGLNVSRPVNITTGPENTFRHIHDKVKRKRDMTKCFNQRDITRRRDRQTGLSNVVYKLKSMNEVTIDGAPLTIVNIELNCDRSVTPWCDCNDTMGKNNSTISTQPKSRSNNVAQSKKKRNINVV